MCKDTRVSRSGRRGPVSPRVRRALSSGGDDLRLSWRKRWPGVGSILWADSCAPRGGSPRPTESARTAGTRRAGPGGRGVLPHGTGATAHRRPDPEGSGGRRPLHVCVGFGPRLLIGKPGPRPPVWVSELSLAESPHLGLRRSDDDRDVRLQLELVTGQAALSPGTVLVPSPSR